MKSGSIEPADKRDVADAPSSAAAELLSDQVSKKVSGGAILQHGTTTPY